MLIGTWKKWDITDIDLAFFFLNKVLSSPNLSSQLQKGICAWYVLLCATGITSNHIHGWGDDGHVNVWCSWRCPTAGNPAGFPPFAESPLPGWNGIKECHRAGLSCCHRIFSFFMLYTVLDHILIFTSTLISNARGRKPGRQVSHLVSLLDVCPGADAAWHVLGSLGIQSIVHTKRLLCAWHWGAQWWTGHMASKRTWESV